MNKKFIFWEFSDIFFSLFWLFFISALIEKFYLYHCKTFLYFRIFCFNLGIYFLFYNLYHKENMKHIIYSWKQAMSIWESFLKFWHRKNRNKRIKVLVVMSSFTHEEIIIIKSLERNAHTLDHITFFRILKEVNSWLLD